MLSFSVLKKSLKDVIRSYVSGTFEDILKRKASILKSISHKSRIEDVFVSMTTYGPRVQFFEYSILSILDGSVLPEKILVYVPFGFKKLLKDSGSFLTEIYDSGFVELIEMNEDLGPHSKYFYSFRDFGEQKDIVLCDDDVVYYRDWLKQLVLAAENTPSYSVFGYKVVNVQVESDHVLSYDKWIHLDKGSHQKGNLLYAEGVGGVFYRKGTLRVEVFNKEVFEQLAPKADDVWLWYCSYLNDAKIKHIQPTSHRLLYVIPNSQIVNLWSENTTNKRNDIYVENCRQYFIEKYNMDIIKFS